MRAFLWPLAPHLEKRAPKEPNDGRMRPEIVMGFGNQAASSNGSNGRCVEGKVKEREAATVIVGGGIAGLAALWRLAERGRPRDGGLLLLEREPLCGSAASGRNAGIFRHLEHDGVSAALAMASRRLLSKLSPSEGLLKSVGAAYLSAGDEPLDHLLSLAESIGVRAKYLQTTRAVGGLRDLVAGGEVRRMLLVPEDGVLDVHGVLEAVRRSALSKGAKVRCGSSVEEVEVSNGRVIAVLLDDGSRISCDRVVIAAGAWSAHMGASAEAPMPLAPFRRHLVFLERGEERRAQVPVLWRVDEQVYLRPESGGFLASPCDESPWPAVVEPPADRSLLFDLAVRLDRSMPAVADSAVRRIWACLRTFAPDRNPVVGADPRVGGLFWLGGLGGQGLSTGLGAADVLAALMEGEEHPLAASLSPAREALQGSNALKAARSGP